MKIEKVETIWYLGLACGFSFEKNYSQVLFRIAFICVQFDIYFNRCHKFK